MTGYDYVVFLIVGVAAIAGFFRGFIEEVMSLLAWAIALLAVHYLHEPVTYLIAGWLGSETGAGVLAFGLLLALPFFATRLIARRLGDASRQSSLGPIDRVLGFGFGAVKGFIIMVLGFSLLVFAYDVVWGPKGRPHWITAGRTYPFLNAASEELLTIVAERRAAAISESAPHAGGAPAADAAPVHHSGAKPHHHRHPAADD